MYGKYKRNVIEMYWNYTQKNRAITEHPCYSNDSSLLSILLCILTIPCGLYPRQSAI